MGSIITEHSKIEPALVNTVRPIYV